MSDPLRLLSILLFPVVFMTACENPGEPRFKFENQGREVPAFSADNAYEHIQTQLAFGPRVPNNRAHEEALHWMTETLRNVAGDQNVFVQSFTHTGYADSTLNLHNLMASFNTEQTDRILLAAHWDTRPMADMDSLAPEKPIPGADDGASGVGVLLELARIFQEQKPPVGIDIVLFDGEDYGESGDLDHYFLGSRFWSRDETIQRYHPRFGILLDMVGARSARFSKEGYSVRAASSLVDALWEVAQEIGYEEYFPDQEGAFISDDHVVVQRNTGIRMINIINHGRRENGGADFPDHWHTHRDDMDVIDRETLQAVGDLLVEIIYNRIPRP